MPNEIMRNTWLPIGPNSNMAMPDTRGMNLPNGVLMLHKDGSGAAAMTYVPDVVLLDPEEKNTSSSVFQFHPLDKSS